MYEFNISFQHLVLKVSELPSSLSSLTGLLVAVVTEFFDQVSSIFGVAYMSKVSFVLSCLFFFFVAKINN